MIGKKGIEIMDLNYDCFDWNSKCLVEFLIIDVFVVVKKILLDFLEEKLVWLKKLSNGIIVLDKRKRKKSVESGVDGELMGGRK